MDSEQPTETPTSPQENHIFQRNRRRGASGRGMHAPQNGIVHGSGSRGGRGDGPRGRGPSNHNRIPRSNAPGLLPHAMTGAASSFDAPLGDGKAGREASSNHSDNAVDESLEGDVCFICASTIEHTSIASCNHQTCHICSLRLRALYKTRACAHCRVSQALQNS